MNDEEWLTVHRALDELGERLGIDESWLNDQDEGLCDLRQEMKALRRRVEALELRPQSSRETYENWTQNWWIWPTTVNPNGIDTLSDTGMVRIRGWQSCANGRVMIY